MTLADIANVGRGTRKMGVKRKPHRRSCVFLAAVKGEGLVTDVLGFMGSESCVQRFMFQAWTEALDLTTGSDHGAGPTTPERAGVPKGMNRSARPPLKTLCFVSSKGELERHLVGRSWRLTQPKRSK